MVVYLELTAEMTSPATVMHQKRMPKLRLREMHWKRMSELRLREMLSQWQGPKFLLGPKDECNDFR